MTPQKWDNVLKLNRFAGTEYVLNDYRDSRCQELGVIVSSAIEPSLLQPSFPKTIILSTEDSLTQHEVALRLRDALYSKCSPTCEIATLEEAVALPDLSERFCIVLPELETPFLPQLAQDSFTRLQSALTSAQGISEYPRAVQLLGSRRKFRPFVNQLGKMAYGLTSYIDQSIYESTSLYMNAGF